VEDGTSEVDDGASELDSGGSDEEDGVGSGLLVCSVEDSGSGEDEESPEGGGVLVGEGGGAEVGVSPGAVGDVGSGPGVPSVPELLMMRCRWLHAYNCEGEEYQHGCRGSIGR
jgi:hypothetical protein